MVSSKTAEVVETTLKRVVNGEYYLLPVFVSQFMTYLGEGTPHPSDSVGFSRNIGLKGAHLLYVLQNEAKKELNPTLKGEEDESSSTSPVQQASRRLLKSSTASTEANGWGNDVRMLFSCGMGTLLAGSNTRLHLLCGVWIATLVVRLAGARKFVERQQWMIDVGVGAGIAYSSGWSLGWSGILDAGAYYAARSVFAYI